MKTYYCMYKIETKDDENYFVLVTFDANTEGDAKKAKDMLLCRLKQQANLAELDTGPLCLDSEHILEALTKKLTHLKGFGKKGSLHIWQSKTDTTTTFTGDEQRVVELQGRTSSTRINAQEYPMYIMKQSSKSSSEGSVLKISFEENEPFTFTKIADNIQFDL